MTCLRRPRARHGLYAAILALVLAVATGCALGEPKDHKDADSPALTPSWKSQSPADKGVGMQTLAKNLSVPWGIAFLPDGSALVTERDSHKLLKVDSGGKVSTEQTVTQAGGSGEGGLLGVTVSPHYDQDKTIFLYYTTDNDNRIASLKLGESPKPIVTGIPANSNHNGGRLGFGPDGYLYASTGDARKGSNAQDLGNLGGKILRMTPDGKPAPGNPFPDSLVWSYGHRNVEGFGWDSKTRMYATEFGEDTADEINLIEPGKNYGWPDVEGPTSDSRYVSPLVHWSPDEASPSGMVVVNGETIITANLAGQRLWAVTLDGNGGVKGEPTPLLRNKYGRLRTIALAPDGSLWLTTSNRDGRGSPAADDDRIIRIVLPSGGNAGVV